MNNGIGGICLNKDTLFFLHSSSPPLPFLPQLLIMWIFLKDTDDFVLFSCFQTFHQRAKDND